jgi:hypothetical protein
MNDQQSDDQQKDADRPAWHEELRFAKKQQWYIATSAITLLAAIFAIAHGTSLSDEEKGIASIFILLIASFGILYLCKLQAHLKEVRKKLNPRDSGAWVRGSHRTQRSSGFLFPVGSPRRSRSGNAKPVDHIWSE